MNISRRDGQRGVLQVVLKHGAASTVEVVRQVREAIPKIPPRCPDIDITMTGDKSILVRAAINGVLHEAAIAAGLTALLILIFLGSWRSTLVVAISIPLSILTSLLVMSMLGETIDIMTLGGLALTVLVDDATVEIEDIDRLLPEGIPLRIRSHGRAADRRAGLRGHAQSSASCSFPSSSKGVPGFLFRPLAEAVVFTMLASYFLSRTLVPSLVM